MPIVFVGVMLCNILKIIEANDELFGAIKVILQKLLQALQNLTDSEDFNNLLVS